MKQWHFSPLPQGEYEHNDNGAGGKYKGKLVLRPSSIDSYIRCPYAFYKQQLMGEYGAPNSASQVGTALHFVMEEAIGLGRTPRRNYINNNETVDPMTYNDIQMMQNQLSNDTGFSSLRSSIGYEDLNNELKKLLRRNHPEIDVFLKSLANELKLDPIETIIECIKVAMSTKSLEPDALYDINKELNQLEKEKNDELATRFS